MQINTYTWGCAVYPTPAAPTTEYMVRVFDGFGTQLRYVGLLDTKFKTWGTRFDAHVAVEEAVASEGSVICTPAKVELYKLVKDGEAEVKEVQKTERILSYWRG